MPNLCERAVAPQRQWRPGGMGIGPQLLLAVLVFGLFHLDDDVGDSQAVGIEHHDIGALGRVTAEGDRILDRNPPFWVAEAAQQAV